MYILNQAERHAVSGGSYVYVTQQWKDYSAYKTSSMCFVVGGLVGGTLGTLAAFAVGSLGDFAFATIGTAYGVCVGAAAGFLTGYTYSYLSHYHLENDAWSYV